MEYVKDSLLEKVPLQGFSAGTIRGEMAAQPRAGQVPDR